MPCKIIVSGELSKKLINRFECCDDNLGAWFGLVSSHTAPSLGDIEPGERAFQSPLPVFYAMAAITGMLFTPDGVQSLKLAAFGFVFDTIPVSIAQQREHLRPRPVC